MKTIAQVWGGAVLKIVVKYNIINHNFSYLFFVMCEKSFVPIVFFFFHNVIFGGIVLNPILTCSNKAYPLEQCTRVKEKRYAII